MLDKKEYEEFMGETGMILNPRDRYLINKTKEEYEEKLKQQKQETEEKLKQQKQEIAEIMCNEKIPINTIIKVTGLTKEEIPNAK